MPKEKQMEFNFNSVDAEDLKVITVNRMCYIGKIKEDVALRTAMIIDALCCGDSVSLNDINLWLKKANLGELEEVALKGNKTYTQKGLDNEQRAYFVQRKEVMIEVKKTAAARWENKLFDEISH